MHAASIISIVRINNTDKCDSTLNNAKLAIKHASCLRLKMTQERWIPNECFSWAFWGWPGKNRRLMCSLHGDFIIMISIIFIFLTNEHSVAFALSQFLLPNKWYLCLCHLAFKAYILIHCSLIWLDFYLEAVHTSSAEHFLLNWFKGVQMSEQLEGQVYLAKILFVCMCVYTLFLLSHWGFFWYKHWPCWDQ